MAHGFGALADETLRIPVQGSNGSRSGEEVNGGFSGAGLARLFQLSVDLPRRREGCYLLRSNPFHQDPGVLWEYYIQLPAMIMAGPLISSSFL